MQIAARRESKHEHDPRIDHRQANTPHRRTAQDHRHRAVCRRFSLRPHGARCTGGARPSPAAAFAHLDTSAAEKMPGVLLVLHHGNIGPLYRTVPGDDNATNSEVRSAFEDEMVRHWGQYVAVVVAETLEQATAAAAAVQVEYDAEPAQLRPAWTTTRASARTAAKRGDFDGAFEDAPVKIDQTYITPIETHNPIELHASVAVWDGDHVTHVRDLAGRRESSRGDGADARHPGRECPRRDALSRIRIRRQALPLAALRDERGRRAQTRPSGQTER